MNGAIKVSDFGLTEDVYTANYYRQEWSETGNNEKLPIRWMAPESIKSDMFTEKTDVVKHYNILRVIVSSIINIVYGIPYFSGHLE